VLDRVLERLLHHAVEHERRFPRQRVGPGAARDLDGDAVARRELGGEAAGGREQPELVEDRGVELVGDPVQVARERAGAVGARCGCAPLPARRSGGPRAGACAPRPSAGGAARSAAT
jgi:hypothetical protein